MQRTSIIKLCLGLMAVLAIGSGVFLVANYNISTDYASAMPTATQTVRVCHNDCRYLSPGIAFLLHLGLGLFVAGGIALVALRIWPQKPANSGATASAKAGNADTFVTAFIGVLHGAAFACAFATFSAPDSWRENESPAPSPGYVYNPSAHHELSYAGAAQATLSHMTLPLWSALAAFTLIALFLRHRRGAPARGFDRNDLPAIGGQLTGIVIAAAILMAFGHVIVDTLIDSPFGPK